MHNNRPSSEEEMLISNASKMSMWDSSRLSVYLEEHPNTLFNFKIDLSLFIHFFRQCKENFTQSEMLMQIMNNFVSFVFL
mmetsp:Transcript_30273/g.34661  ORF Transcript_30273/g.34661 Transcript_30273/m.34661 type:complete len:80 (-) Transcript_30273:466-705(-)